MATKKITDKEAAQAAKALELLFASSYINKKKLYWENFVRGITFSIGSIVGATIGITIIVWLLSLFTQVPFVGKFVKNMQESVNSQSK